MKAKLGFKLLFFLPIIIFANYIVMAIIGCTSCFFGAGNDYMCGTYCLIGKIVLGLSVILFLYLIFPEIKGLMIRRYGKTD